ncbi:MAG: hypothetical protein OK438_07490 [Thaumarchaeota archaeon]|nr:hypothetical protein [Nitrososphaerota archaeon]
MKLVQERTAVKILVEPNGLLVSFTTKKRACFFFVSAAFLGAKVAPTTDPYPGIVEECGYDIRKIIHEWDRLSRFKGNARG